MRKIITYMRALFLVIVMFLTISTMAEAREPVKEKVSQEHLQELISRATKETLVKFFNVVKKGNQQQVNALLKQHKNLAKLADEHQVTALMVACNAGHLNIVKDLVRAGADVNAVNDTGHSAFMYAKHKGYTEIVNFLASKGVDVSEAYLGWRGPETDLDTESDVFHVESDGVFHR